LTNWLRINLLLWVWLRINLLLWVWLRINLLLWVWLRRNWHLLIISFLEQDLDFNKGIFFSSWGFIRGGLLKEIAICKPQPCKFFQLTFFPKSSLLQRHLIFRLSFRVFCFNFFFSQSFTKCKLCKGFFFLEFWNFFSNFNLRDLYFFWTFQYWHSSWSILFPSPYQSFLSSESDFKAWESWLDKTFLHPSKTFWQLQLHLDLSLGLFLFQRGSSFSHSIDCLWDVTGDFINKNLLGLQRVYYIHFFSRKVHNFHLYFYLFFYKISSRANYKLIKTNAWGNFYFHFFRLIYLSNLFSRKFSFYFIFLQAFFPKHFFFLS